MVGEVTYFGNQPWPFPASLMLGFLGRASTDDDRGRRRRDRRTRAGSPARRCRPRPGRRRCVLPGGVSITRSLVEHWYGGPLPGLAGERSATVTRASAASFSLTWASDGFVCAVPSA